MTARPLLLAILVAFTSLGCKANDPKASHGPVAQAPAKPAGPASVTPPTAPADHRKVVRTGALRITVDRYDTAREKLDEIIASAGGYVDSTQVIRGRDAVTDATIVVRVPSDKLAGLVPMLRDVGEITSETTSAEDITAQYIDVDARLASAKTLEARLLQLASERSGTIDSVLAVERELARVRGEIEGYERHLRQWDDQVAMSTLTVTLSTRNPEIVAASSFSGRVANAFHSSIQALRALGGWFVVTCVALFPWLLILGPIALVARKAAAKLRA